MAFRMTKEWYFCSVACLLLLVELGRLEPIPNFNLHNAIPMEYKNCLGLKQPLGYSKRNPINLIVNNWFGSAVNAHIAKIILEEVIGIQTTLLEIDNQIDNWALLGSGKAHAVLEIWGVDTKPIIQQYESDQAISSAGPLGIIGEIGWYVPRYVQDYASEVLFGTFSEQAADYFNHTFYLGSSAWTTEDQAIIDYNHWDLTIKNLTGEYEFLELLLDRYSKNEPILFYFWKPHPIHQILDLVKIQLEDAVINGQRNTWYPPDIPTKFIWAHLPSYSYETSHFIKAFTYGVGDQTGITSELLLNGSSYNEATCRWIKNNKEMWAFWVPPVKYQEVPTSLQIAMYALASFSICVVGFYLVMTLIKYRTKVIVAASGMFLIIMCVGGLMIFGSVIAWTSNTSEGCSVFIWLLSTGFALLFASLFAKNARIYMLFSNRSLQVVKYSDRDIAVGVVCLVAGEWALVIAGQIVQPPNYEFVNYGNVQYSFCIFHVPTGITLLVYNGLMIVVGVVITALVSKLKLTLYNESRYIALAVYNFAFAAIFFIIVFFVQDVVARFAVTCCAIIFIGNTALGVIFIPKLKLLFKYTPEQLQKMNDEQLNSMIRGFSKKFESPSVRTSTKESKTTHPVVVDSSGVRARDTVQVSTVSSLEDEISKLSSNVHIVSAKNEELRKENAELKAHISRLTYEGSKTTDDNAS